MLAARLDPNIVFSHATAALLLGAPLPMWCERRPNIDITMASPARAPHARGIAGHQLAIGDDEIQLKDGLRVSSPARTWADLGNVLILTDLVAVGDYFVQWRLPLCTKADLSKSAHASFRRRGVRRLREAAPLIDERSESRPESTLRVILLLAGFPKPLINRDIVDTDFGFVARTDFEFKDFGLVLEYQGDYHRIKVGQWRKDMTRKSRLQALGKETIELNADDLRDELELVSRIRTALRRRGWPG
jgi:hypothetical protein